MFKNNRKAITGAACAAFALWCAHAPVTAAATAAVSAGGSHSIALGTDGIVRSWGSDATGQLGLGRALASSRPAVVPGLSAMVAVAAGDAHVAALRSDGTVLTWGENRAGQLGDGTRTDRSTPAAVNGLSGVIAIRARGAHTVALKADGSVWAWGSNGVGELGDGTYEDRLAPVRIAALQDVVEIASGGQFNLARRRDGSVWAWGANESGQLGDGMISAIYSGRATPAPVAGLREVVALAAGGQHALARFADGSVWAWGANGGGQLGDGTTTTRSSPVRVAGLATARAIAAGHGHSIAILDDGAVWAWGSNGYGQLGDGSFVDRPQPVRLSGIAAPLMIATGFLHSIAVAPDGAIVAWGHNERGELGDGMTAQRLTPALVAGVGGISAVAVGDQFSVALRSDGSVMTWGDDASGQLGNGGFIFRSTPSLPGVAGVERISAGGAHGVALHNDGSVRAWGRNDAGQLGDGTRQNRASAVAVTSLGAGSGVVAIAAGGLHTLALKGDGTVLSWGYDFSGALGGRTQSDETLPARVTGVADVAAIAAGADHSVALSRDGAVWAWGRNERGQLGSGALTSGYAGRSTPQQVAGLGDVTAVAAGGAHTLALRADGTVWAWGGNFSGQLGDGTLVDRSTPVQVAGLASAVAIAAGDVHSLALLADGTVWSWGANYDSQLGDGSAQDRATPVRVAGLTRVVAISAASHSLALTDDGSVRAWGKSESGRLGDGTLVDRATPVVVLREEGAGSTAGNDWFLDLAPAVATSIPPENVPVFLVVASAAGDHVSADIRFRTQDIGSTASVYVFALAPAASVPGSAAPAWPLRSRQKARGAKDTEVACVLAQLSTSGQLRQVSASSLQAYVSGVLSAQGQAVTILEGVPTVHIAGATFYVGYGASAGAMLSGGTNRSVVSVPGAAGCQPQAPQTGWWWNPAEGGRGFSLEKRGNNLFFASYLYEASGRSSWYAASGPVSLDGALFDARLQGFANGQTFAGGYRAPGAASDAGALVLAFSDATHGTLVWPGGTIPIERFGIEPGGLAAAPRAGQPESGWWWNESESGRGFYIEWQGASSFVAGYMYDEAGNPLWYAAQQPTPDAREIRGTWLQYANGQALGSAYRAPSVVNANVAPLEIRFDGVDSGFLTLPGGRLLPIRRFRF